MEVLVFAVAELDALPGNFLSEVWLRAREAIPPLWVVRWPNLGCLEFVLDDSEEGIRLMNVNHMTPRAICCRETGRGAGPGLIK